MPADHTPPEVGSLWQHKDGERRFVQRHGWESNYPVGRCEIVSVSRTGRIPVGDKYGNWANVNIPLADWSAWERDAVRIDNAPRGEEQA